MKAPCRRSTDPIRMPSSGRRAPAGPPPRAARTGPVQPRDRPDPHAVEWPDSAGSSPIERALDWLRLETAGVIGPRGWRSLIGRFVFAPAAISLLAYDHLNHRMPSVVFWLTLGLIVTIFARMLETNRRQRLALEERDLEAFSDRGVCAAADDRLGRIAQRLVAIVDPLGGIAYRFDEGRFAVLVPAVQQQLGEIVLVATASLHSEGQDMPIGRTYGEVAIPSDAADAETAFQIAGQRLAAHKQGQHHSARRQAHAVLVAALSARRPDLRDHLRIVTYRAISLARRLGVNREEIDDIALAAELRDVGRLTVPESVLEKEAPHSAEETALIRRPPLEGARVIAAAPGLELG